MNMTPPRPRAGRLTLGSVGIAVLVCLAAAGCGDKSPTAPTPPQSSTPTRIIGVTGNLAFGEVPVGSSREATFTITNSGSAALNVSSLTVTGGLATHTAASWTSGQIAAGGSQSVLVRFSPTSAGVFVGTLTVNADQSSGSNTIAISGTGVDTNSAAGTWSGRYVVERCDGTGSVQDIFCSANRGLFPVGTSLPLALQLTQSGANVSGTLALGTVTGPVSGVISPGGVLSLQGTATANGITAVLTNWTSTVSGGTMSGLITYNLTLAGTPGVASVTSRLAGVTK